MTTVGRTLGPGRYGLAQLQIGDRIVTDTRTVSANMIDAFADLSGDRFAIHMDASAAAGYGFSGRVAHGLLVLSVIDGLKNQAVAQFDAIASLGWDWTFNAPILADEGVRALITVADLRVTSDQKRGVATLDFDVTNQSGATVQRGQNRLLMRI